MQDLPESVEDLDSRKRIIFSTSTFIKHAISGGLFTYIVLFTAHYLNQPVAILYCLVIATSLSGKLRVKGRYLYFLDLVNFLIGLFILFRFNLHIEPVEYQVYVYSPLLLAAALLGNIAKNYYLFGLTGNIYGGQPPLCDTCGQEMNETKRLVKDEQFGIVVQVTDLDCLICNKKAQDVEV
ncbi:hypothetical protein AB4455_07830 [Vibrio sp. 10N.261.46.E12]|uniref:hypothetical protein n=1 Tax=unclassified Vibrio TaxID=2614977 RepID=UPI0009758B52|nr:MULTISPECIES: hypothetical protein [unclassified Vibrio]OMO34451.1 hypothetical protein BH584_12550 [Vibrio sp. 10N.261.45.E1]PMJ26226.1 hypothetical protein BCU27_09735 [Vibrio sp. 10N.286.45.B6]PML82780.1 hypothetical protein BCT66_20030 [Vibrio sp. 10N.261.49.E11]PMM90304.1 hypothetical protein BCT46_23455 [Vibrio sp. 10N.261.46.E8]PMN43924.1 hypothetical protein BCT32_00735 [Vibrio sp. 10N.261.45.E11]